MKKEIEEKLLKEIEELKSEDSESNLENDLFKEVYRIYCDDFPINNSYDARLKRIISFVREKSQDRQLKSQKTDLILSKLKQHEETKKAERERFNKIIDKKLNGTSDDSEFALGWEHGLEELKKELEEEE